MLLGFGIDKDQRFGFLLDLLRYALNGAFFLKGVLLKEKTTTTGSECE